MLQSGHSWTETAAGAPGQDPGSGANCFEGVLMKKRTFGGPAATWYLSATKGRSGLQLTRSDGQPATNNKIKACRMRSGFETDLDDG